MFALVRALRVVRAAAVELVSSCVGASWSWWLQLVVVVAGAVMVGAVMVGAVMVGGGRGGAAVSACVGR